MNQEAITRIIKSITKDSLGYKEILEDKRTKELLEIYENTDKEIIMEDILIQMYLMGYEDKREKGE